MSSSSGGMQTRLEGTLSQRLVLTPRLQHAIALLQLSRLELEQQINVEMMENPVLEDALSEGAIADHDEGDIPNGQVPTEDSGTEVDPKWESYAAYDDRGEIEWPSASDSEEQPSIDQFLTKPMSLTDHLLWQMNLTPFSPFEKDIATALIGNIDEDGYLQGQIPDIAESVGAPVSTVECVLTVLQGFDPPGVATRTLTECLRVQVAQLGLTHPLVDAMIVSHLEDLSKKRYEKIAKACGTVASEVVAAEEVIRRLEPKPGRPYSGTGNVAIVPDVIVVESGETYTAVLSDDGLPRLRISPLYRDMLRSGSALNDQAKRYLGERFRSAIWLVRTIEQRNRTILRVGKSILKFQHDFMRYGKSALKPLVLKQVAEDIEMHESTVSRVTSNKYIQTPQGIYLMKFFFNACIPSATVRTNEDDGFSSIAVQECIREIISEEPPAHPMSDQAIVQILKRQRNIAIARRTVSKYREQLHIPSAHRRRTVPMAPQKLVFGDPTLAPQKQAFGDPTL